MYSDITGMLLENKYMVKEALGEGGFSKVYKVWDEHLKCEFAMKVMKIKSEESNIENEQVLREIDMLRQLEHKGLPRLHDVFLYENVICIVMELIRGETLEEYVMKNGKLSEDMVWEVAKQMSEILHYLHSLPMPVIYGDLKPGNIIFYQGKIRMVDLGGAFYQFGTDTYFYATRGYAAAELERGECTTRSDVYSFGRILIFLLTGRHPFLFGKESVVKTLKTYGVSANMRKMIEKCVFDDAAKRFRSGYELSDTLCRRKGRKKCFLFRYSGDYRKKILECECSLFVSQGL